MRTFVWIFAAVAHLLLLDAATKEFAVRCLRGAPAISVIPGFFNLAYVENRGCAWGLLQGHVWPLAVFGLAVTVVLVWRRREVFSLDARGWRRRAGAVAECLLYAGIAGNLVDRVARGHVVDFFDFHWGEVWHFPCFNVADVCITAAAGLLILVSAAGDGGPRAASDASAKRATP